MKHLTNIGNWKTIFKIHTDDKPFKCNVCDKSFILNWRLKKHIEGHKQLNIKFCHYYNNNKICKYEEVIGCVFKHEMAPLCQNFRNSRITKFQFIHTKNDVNESDSAIEIVEEVVDNKSDHSY